MKANAVRSITISSKNNNIYKKLDKAILDAAFRGFDNLSVPYYFMHKYVESDYATPDYLYEDVQHYLKSEGFSVESSFFRGEIIISWQ